MKFYNKHSQIIEASNKEKFLIRAKKFKNELNALLDKYGFCFEGNIDNTDNTDDITASLYIKETEFTDSKRHKIKMLDFQDGNEIEYPELKVDSVIQESY